ncbi:MAG: DitF protein [Pseudonocardiales bacterium]|nr:MAG: DitF protein [Pseudonocardiales bacterium]
MSTEAVIAAASEARYTRHPEADVTSASLIARAVEQVLTSAGLRTRDVDGFAVASFTISPDHAIDLAWRLGFVLRWLMEDTNGGASGLNMLQHAAQAIGCGDAELIVIASGDRIGRAELAHLNATYNLATRDHLVPVDHGGPNALFAMLTARHARTHGLTREDYACIPLAQRRWAHANPGAVYQTPLDLAEYLAAPTVAAPLNRYDCVPVVSGADAIIVTTTERARALNLPGVRIRALKACHNFDDQQGDGLVTGFDSIAADLWRTAEVTPADLDAAYLYDDYPVMVAVQAAALGLVEDDLGRFLHQRLLERQWPLNTSGGQLSAGQAGAAGGMHGLVEAIGQLTGRAPGRQLHPRLALVTGYGMTLYRHGACHNAAVLERIR